MDRQHLEHALCELQGCVHDARLRMAEVYRKWTTSDIQTRPAQESCRVGRAVQT
jgi:hypothetical protein